MAKSIITLKTGLFNHDEALEKAINADQDFDLTTLNTQEEWDEVIEAILECDLVISL